MFLPQGLTHVLRLIRRSPGFFATTILTLALGIGASTALFAALYSVLLKPLPLPDSRRLVRVYNNYNKLQLLKVATPPGEYRDLTAMGEIFASVGASQATEVLVQSEGEPENLPCLQATASLLPTLGLNPALGRGLATEGDTAGGTLEVLLSHGYWQRRFGSDPGVLGRSLLIDGQAHAIVGVLPKGFVYQEPGAISKPDLWISLALAPNRWANRSSNILTTVGRIQPGVSLEAASRRLKEEGVRMAQAQDYPTFIGFSWSLTDLKESLVGDRRRIFQMLLGVVGLVFLIACANAASLLLARAVARKKETVLRAALGATPGHLVQQGLAESLMVALAGGAFGLPLAWGGLGLVRSLGTDVPRLAEARLDLPVLGFALAASLLACLLSGLLPAIQAWRLNLDSVLREDGRGGSTPATRTRRVLVAAEVAMALLAIASAGLIGKSFRTALGTHPGGHIEELAQFSLALPASLASEPGRLEARQRSLLESLAQVPGVQSAALCSLLPLEGEQASSTIGIEGWTDPDIQPRVDFRYVTAAYPEALGMKLLRGRLFTDQDQARVAVINETLARRYFPGRDALGGRMDWGQPVEIIGVVSDLKNRGLEAPVFPELLMPFHQAPKLARFHAVLRGGLGPAALLPVAREALRRTEPSLAITGEGSMAERLKDSLAPRRFASLLVGTLGLLALVLAGGGIYGLMTFLVRLRGRELAVRSALGADPMHLLALVMKEGLLLTALGVAGGLLLLPLLSASIRSLLFQAAPFDPMMLLGSCALLLVSALLACLIPALRAARVQPAVALRSE